MIQQNRIFKGSIIMDLGKKYRVKAFIDLNYRTIKISKFLFFKFYQLLQ